MGGSRLGVQPALACPIPALMLLCVPGMLSRLALRAEVSVSNPGLCVCGLRGELPHPGVPALGPRSEG